jgi:hypothetical protein
MRRISFAFLCFLAIGALHATAEQVTVNYTEPTASATLAYTTVYWCIGAGCTDWVVVKEPKKGIVASDNGNGGDVKAVPLLVPLTQGTLPLTIRVKVTATDTATNETTGVIASHTFN